MTLNEQLTGGFDLVFDQLKESITYRTVSITRNSKDDPIESTSDETIDGVVQVLSLDELQQLGGIYKPGDAELYIKSTQTVAARNKIVHNSVVYELHEKVPEFAGGLVYQRWLMKRSE